MHSKVISLYIGESAQIPYEFILICANANSSLLILWSILKEASQLVAVLVSSSVFEAVSEPVTSFLSPCMPD